MFTVACHVKLLKISSPTERNGKVFSFTVTTSGHKAINISKYFFFFLKIQNIDVKPCSTTITSLYVSLFFLDTAYGTKCESEIGRDKYDIKFKSPQSYYNQCEVAEWSNPLTRGIKVVCKWHLSVSFM